MHRRQILKYGVFGAAAALAPSVTWAQSTGSSQTFNLAIEPVDAEMIDGTLVYMVVFYGDGRSTPSKPRPVLRVTEGQMIRVNVTNNDTQDHGFTIAGVPGTTIARISPASTATITFQAPPGGSYLYLDPLKAPLNRVLGLHGAFVSLPDYSSLPSGAAQTPYSNPTPAAQSLFNALGTTTHFPGDRWHPSDAKREKVWLFSGIDPRINAAIDAGQSVDPASLTASTTGFVPRYFTLNGLSGFDVHEDHSTVPEGYVGEPCLIRTLNAGLAVHSPHIHGNHIMELSRSTRNEPVQVLDNIFERDTWILAPLDRVDVLLPFEKPGDIPAAKWPPKEEPFPMRYVMHCHCEMSQTAAGGNYPQGLVTHWELKGPLRS